MDFVVTEKNYAKGMNLGEQAEALFSAQGINKPAFFVLNKDFFSDCINNNEFSINGINALFSHIKKSGRYCLTPAVFLKNGLEMKKAIPPNFNVSESELMEKLISIYNSLFSIEILKRKKELGSTDILSLTVLITECLPYDQVENLRPETDAAPVFLSLVNKVREKIHPFLNISVGLLKGKTYLISAETADGMEDFIGKPYTKTLINSDVSDFLSGAVSPLTCSFYITLAGKIFNAPILEVAVSRLFLKKEELEKIKKRFKHSGKPLTNEAVPNSINIDDYKTAFEKLMIIALPAFKNALFFKNAEKENKGKKAGELLSNIVGAISLNEEICKDFKTLNTERLKRKYYLMNAVQDFLREFGVLTQHTFKLETETLIEDCSPLISAIETSLKTGECDLKLSTLNEHSFLAAKFVSAFRKIFIKIGEQFSESGLINYPKDIFFLYAEEIFAYYENKNKDHEFKKKISKRIAEFNEDKLKKEYSKIIFYDNKPVIFIN